jgi:arylformamidase
MIDSEIKKCYSRNYSVASKESFTEGVMSMSEFPSETYIDLSHSIHSGTQTYKGLPAPLICDFLSREASRSNYESGTEFHIARIEMVSNTGTYMDCPFHRYEDGKGFDQIPIANSTDLPAIRIRAKQKSIDQDVFADLSLRGKAVLFETGWSKHWGTETYFEQHPFLTENAATYLVQAGARLVGIDSHNIDDTRTRTRPVHSILLGSGVLIVEHLCNLDALPDSGFTFTALPPKFVGVGTFPVRAYAKLKLF